MTPRGRVLAKFPVDSVLDDLRDGGVYELWGTFSVHDRPGRRTYLMRREGDTIHWFSCRRTGRRHREHLPQPISEPIDDFYMTRDRWRAVPVDEEEWLLARLAGEWVP